MKTLKNVIFLIGLTSFLAISTSCSDDDSSNNNLSIKARATNSFNQSRNSTITISEFKINMKEIELEFDDDYEEMDIDGYIDYEDEIEFEGPFEIDLLSGTSILASVELPEANYEEIEFEFDKNTNPSSDMFNRTVVIQGAIDGIPFIFWHDFEEEIEVDFENEANDINISASLTEIIINFDLDSLLSQVDISNATDGNQDGTIEISPEDNDGNNALADSLKEALKQVAELLDD